MNLRFEQEKRLLEQLVELPDGSLETWLAGVLTTLAEVVAARRGFLEVYRTTRHGERQISVSVKCTREDEAVIRAVTSRGIVAEAMASGETVHTPMALLDERFSKLESVQEQRLEAVLCAPLRHLPGVLYLEGAPGRPFSPEDVALVERMARYLGAVLGPRALRLFDGVDHTDSWRALLKADGIIGTSRALARVLEQAAHLAPVDIAVLLLGESGTGKTQLARAIHASSKRAAGPFVELNCGAIPENLVEAELFGTRPGAFTGARAIPGKVELADGGTLFLDEVGELPLASQSRLLQLLSEKQYFKLGGTRSERANVRVVAATNADLENAVKEKTFRVDLWHRLAAGVVRLPSLKERPEDVPLLVEALLRQIAVEHDQPELPPASSLLTLCEVREWPGNVRELRNRLENAVLRARSEGARAVEARHLDPEAPAGARLSLAVATNLFQKDLLRRELEEAGWNVTEVSRRLDLSRQHVHSLIRAFGLKRRDE